MNKILRHALLMLKNGYSPIPCEYASRGTYIKGWPEYMDSPPTKQQVEGWFSSPKRNTAIVCGRIAVYDIDIDDAALAEAVQKKIEHITNSKPPVRIGKSPRRALFFRIDGNSTKTVKTPLGELGEVELLGKGHLCTVAGIHHKTQRPYKWHGNDLTQIKYENLPLLTTKHIEAIEAHLRTIAAKDSFAAAKLKDGREKLLRDIVYRHVQNALASTDIEHINPEQLAEDVWEEFKSSADTSRTKGSDSNLKYTYQDALGKVRYALDRHRQGTLPVHSSNDASNSHSRGVYADYAVFFDEHLPNAKKDLISGNFLIPKGGEYVEANAMLDILSSYADEVPNIAPHRLKAHLARYIHEKEPELLISIPEWDGKDRVRSIAHCLRIKNISNAHAEELLKDWGANFYRRMNNPKVQNRVLVLQGKQGIGKDSWLREMLDGLQHYYGSMTICNEERENLMAAADHAVLSIGEFERVSPKLLASFKHIVSAEQASIRRPYARGTTKHSLRCSFVATSNNKGLLQDTTGNRRFIVFELEGISWNYPQGESLQILAQFKHFADAEYKASQNAEQAMQEYLNLHTPDDPEKLVVELFDMEMQRLFHSSGKDKITYAEAESIFRTIGKRTGQNIKTVSNILHRNGRRKHTNQGQTYFLPELPKSKKKLRLRKTRITQVKGVKGKIIQNPEKKAVEHKPRLRLLAK